MKNSLFYKIVVMVLLVLSLSSCNKNDKISVNNVTLSHTVVALIPGGSITLTATVTPDDATDKTITWKSNNDAVATVNSDGVVNAVSKGMAKITATSTNGKEATCDITVTSSQITMTSQNPRVITLSLAGEGAVAIDWGDGEEVDIRMLSSNITYHSHTYPEELTRTIIISGANITYLYCNSSRLTELDVSKNPELKELFCSINQLTKLDVSANTSLTALYCRENQLTSLNLKGFASLTILHCFNNNLEILELDGCTALRQLNSSNNLLKSLNLDDCIQLRDLNCNINRLTSLDLSKNIWLTTISCRYNRLSGSAINDMFHTLHSRIEGKSVNVSDNYGVDDCNPEIARNKHWSVILN